ncbi:hypothetical protein [Spiroplasma phoeniceum]|nr:hypothetical protein [Spiroplasma phoeniceum]
MVGTFPAKINKFFRTCGVKIVLIDRSDVPPTKNFSSNKLYCKLI